MSTFSSTWSTERTLGQLGLHSKMLPQKQMPDKQTRKFNKINIFLVFFENSIYVYNVVFKTLLHVSIYLLRVCIKDGFSQ